MSDFNVRVAARGEHMRYSVLNFNSDIVNTAKWSNDSNLTMEREDNKGIVLASQSVQEYGAGSEYGKAAREEARRKKFGRQARRYQLDNQPWHMQYNEPDGRLKRLRGIREGGATEHADYWVFLKSSNDEFQAYKVDDWHKFMPAIMHKTLDIDQAEEKFLHIVENPRTQSDLTDSRRVVVIPTRNKVMNQFALKAAIQNQLNAADADGEALDKASRSLKIKDNGSSDDSDPDDDGVKSAYEGGDEKKKKKGKKEKKDKRQRVENADDVAKYESEDGEDEGREYDYMSDSGSDSDREMVPSEEKVERQLVGVEEEDGMKKMFGSDDSDSDDDDLTKKLSKTDKSKSKDNLDIEERDSSGSDSDDPDTAKLDSVVFMPKKDTEGKDDDSGSKKRPAVDDKPSGEAGPSDPKKAKTEERPKFVEGLNEETVRRYLRRKPYTTKDLLHKMKGKCGDMEKSEIVHKLAIIMKAIEPHQFKRTVGKKEVLFFSLTNTVE